MSSNNHHEGLALLGDEAAALGALHAGLSAAYGYPGTPSTEIMEYLIDAARDSAGFGAAWCTNEKTALEAALGVSFAGKRALVTMKHVGLNVASDPFMNGALLEINGGLVIAAADDPGMHSSQGEQDSRFYAFYAMVPCLEPRNQQEAYDMCREAFDVSERFHVPVMLRLSTRLSHARAEVRPFAPRQENRCTPVRDKTRWMLLPAYARRNYADLVGKQQDFTAWSVSHKANRLETEGRDPLYAVITAGLGGNYYEENLEDFALSRGGKIPTRLHIGAYPLPLDSIQKLAKNAETILILEEGQPVIEERLRGLLPQKQTILGKLDNVVPRTGELDPDKVRMALGLAPRPGIAAVSFLKDLPGRPPQLCQGCPHGDSYQCINRAAAELDSSPDRSSVKICSDIGCYSLGALPPYSAIESIVCMGASVGMARGAAAAGVKYAAAVIGDSTFLHSGIPGLLDAVQASAPITVIILDNSTVAMTGCQETILPSGELRKLILGLGVDPKHFLELEAKSQNLEENVRSLKAEMEYQGLSVVVFRRECLEAARKRRGVAAKSNAANKPDSARNTGGAL